MRKNAAALFLACSLVYLCRLEYYTRDDVHKIAFVPRTGVYMCCYIAIPPQDAHSPRFWALTQRRRDFVVGIAKEEFHQFNLRY